jgi:hypothetical protein
MANNYAVTAVEYLANVSNPMVTVGVSGTVSGVSVFVIAYAAALDQSFAANGQPGLQTYLGPLMLAASQNIYGPTIANPNVKGNFPLPSSAPYPNAPGSWSI